MLHFPLTLLCVPLSLPGACCHTKAAALKVGDSLLDFPDYFRALPTPDGTQVALSSFKGARSRASPAFPDAPL
jgi:hypothetical protein